MCRIPPPPPLSKSQGGGEIRYRSNQVSDGYRRHEGMRGVSVFESWLPDSVNGLLSCRIWGGAVYSEHMSYVILFELRPCPRDHNTCCSVRRVRSHQLFLAPVLSCTIYKALHVASHTETVSSFYPHTASTEATVQEKR